MRKIQHFIQNGAFRLQNLLAVKYSPYQLGAGLQIGISCRPCLCRFRSASLLHVKQRLLINTLTWKIPGQRIKYFLP